MKAENAAQAALYRAETKRITAELTFANGGVLIGELHLQPNTLLPEGFETPLDMLNRPEAFYPVSQESGGVVLLSKAQTAVVACSRDAAPHDEQREDAAMAATLEIELASGTKYAGQAIWELPPGHARSLDFLNESDPFLALVDEAHTWYINRAHVRAVYPKD